MSETAAPTSTPSTPVYTGGGHTPSTTSASPDTGTSTHAAPSQVSASKPNNDLGGQTQSTPKPTTPETKAITPDTIRDFKINGKIVKMSQREADDYVSMSYAAQEKFKEAAAIRKTQEQKEELYKKNRIQAFLDYTQDLSPEERRNVLEEYYAKQYIEPETLSQEERALREREAKIKEWETQQKEREETERKAQEEKMTAQQKEFLQSQIIEAMEASDLPKTKFFVSRMAFYMRENMKNGWDAPKEMIVRQVQNERASIMSDLTEQSTAEQLIKMLGEPIINKIRKYDLEQLRTNRQKKNEPFTPTDTTDSNYTDGEKIDYREVNRRLRDIRSGKFVSQG